MIALTSLTESPFDNRRISDAGMMAYTTDHLQRMRAGEAAHGLGLGPRIEATQAAYDEFSDRFTADLSAAAGRKGAKAAKGKFRKGRLIRELQWFHAWTITAGTDFPQAKSFIFPKGRYEVVRTSDDLLGAELRGLAERFRELGEGAVPAEVIETADDLVATWDEIYRKSEASTAQTQKTAADKRAARKVLAWELYLNILEIVRLFPNDKRALERYSVQSLIGFTKPRGER